MSRIGKKEYYLNIAKECSKRGTCLQRNFGAIIVNNDQIISTGYNGAPRGRKNCCDIGTCVRAKLGIEKGTRYELCRAVHAEMNAIIHASRKETLGATLYLCGTDRKTGNIVKDAKPCKLCKATIINAGIIEVNVLTGKGKITSYKVKKWIKNDDTLNPDISNGY